VIITRYTVYISQAILVTLTTRDSFYSMSNKTIMILSLLIRLMDSRSAQNGRTHDQTLMYRGKCVGYVKVGLNIQFSFRRVLQWMIASSFITLSMDSGKDSILSRLVLIKYT
jgi:hypothetical protein